MDGINLQLTEQEALVLRKLLMEAPMPYQVSAPILQKLDGSIRAYALTKQEVTTTDEAVQSATDEEPREHVN